jgi:aryl-alcohol dehydrogenase-like predicted oxidoreductase
VKYRPLGRTGLSVSALSLGTVSLGIDYGIAAPGAFDRPSEDDAIALIRAAVDRGITLIDTAPAYGDAERLVGRAVGRDPRAIVATKTPPLQDVVSGPATGSGPVRVVSRDGFSGTVILSIESSLRALGRDTIDILQLHNATRAMLAARELTDALLDAQRRGLVRVLGATVYGEDAASAAIDSGLFGVIQVAFNVLDQRMMRDVIPAAHAAGVGVVARSALLKGALTPKASWLPDALAPLREAAVRARDALANGSWDALPRAAMRFCLSAPHVASVLTGARTLAELESAFGAEADGQLDRDAMSAAARLAIDADTLLNPSRWPPLGL